MLQRVENVVIDHRRGLLSRLTGGGRIVVQVGRRSYRVPGRCSRQQYLAMLDEPARLPGSFTVLHPRPPRAVTLGRALLGLESVLWLIFGVLLVLAGTASIAGVTSTNANLQILGITPGWQASTILLSSGVVVFIAAMFGVWSATAMGRLTSGPRVTGILLCALGIGLGLADLLAAASGPHVLPNGHIVTVTAASAVAAGVLLVLNLLIVGTLGLAGSARAAFRFPRQPVQVPAPRRARSRFHVAWRQPYLAPPPPRPWMRRRLSATWSAGCLRLAREVGRSLAAGLESPTLALDLPPGRAR
jgi:hypothetical protein